MAGKQSTPALFCSFRRFLFIAAVVLCVIVCLSTTTGANKSERKAAKKGKKQKQHRIMTRLLDELSCRATASNKACQAAIPISKGDLPKVNITTSPTANPMCPDKIYPAANVSISDRSLCPFYHVTMHLPEGFIPRSVPAVKCKHCNICETRAEGCNCKELVTKVTVLRPSSCTLLRRTYEEYSLKVVTACLCTL